MNAPYSLKADRQALLKAVRNVAHFTPNSSRLVKLEISSDQRMTLYGEDFDFSTEANDRIGIDYSGAKGRTASSTSSRASSSRRSPSTSPTPAVP